MFASSHVVVRVQLGRHGVRLDVCTFHLTGGGQ